MNKSFIFIHNKKLVNESSSLKTVLPDAKYVLLGNGDSSEFDGIVARDLPKNVESYDKACAYSGWIALVNNGYIDNDDFIYLFEYDTEVSPSILSVTDEIVGYFALPSTHYMFLEWEPELQKALNQVIPVVDYFHIGYAPMTSNIAMKGKWLKIIAMELEKAIHKLGNHPYLGHVLERLVVFIIWRYNMTYRLYLNAVKHDMKCSHGQLKGYQ